LLPALLLFLFVTFPGDYVPIRPGLDPSWQYALNYLPHSGLQYGTDVTFTHGPLGFLLYPMDIGLNLTIAAAFRLVIHLFFGLAIAYAGLKVTGLLPALLFMAAHLYAMLFGLQYESLLIVTGALWAAISIRSKGAGNLFLPPLAVLAAMCLFIKPTLAVSLLSMLGLAELARLMRGHSRFYTMLLRSVVPFAVMSGILWLYWFGAWKPFEAWLLMTLEYVRYNAVAMSLEGPRSELVAGAGCVGAFIIAAVVLMWMRSEVSVAAIILFPTLVTLFKNGFERQDGHVLFFFAPFIGLLAVLLLVSRRLEELGFVCFAFLAATLAVIPVASARNAFHYAGAVDLLSGKHGLANVKAMANLSATRHRLAMKSQELLTPLDLPDEWTDWINMNGGAMDVLPWQTTYCPANDIPWQPSPTVQSYVAYTPYLDQRLANHFGVGETAPRFLLIEWEGFDDRLLPYNVPVTWRTLLKHYQLAAREPERRLLLLVRRPIPVDLAALESGEVALTLEKWVDVPAEDGMLLAAPDLRLTAEGQLMKSALRIPAVYMEFAFADDKTHLVRILPESTARGIIVNRPPLTWSDAVRTFSENHVPRRAVRFRITGPGTRYYRQETTMILTPLKLVIRSRDQLAKALPPGLGHAAP
jgi:hypothetical protein